MYPRTYTEPACALHADIYCDTGGQYVSTAAAPRVGCVPDSLWQTTKHISGHIIFVHYFSSDKEKSRG